MSHKNERNLTIFVTDETFAWITTKAREHGRARCREVTELIEIERKRDMRRRHNPLMARGGNNV